MDMRILIYWEDKQFMASILEVLFHSIAKPHMPALAV